MNKINIKDNPFLYFAILELKEKHFFCLSAIIYSSILIFSNSLILLGIPVYVLYDYYSDNSGIFNPFIILIFFGFIMCFMVSFYSCFKFYKNVKTKLNIHLNQVNQAFNKHTNFLLWYYINHRGFLKDRINKIFSQYLLEYNEYNSQDINGDTLLHLIIQDNPYSPYISELLLLGADPYIKNNKNISAVDLMPEERQILFIKNDEKQVAYILNSNELKSPVKNKRRL